MSIPTSVLESLREWCIECDDVFIDESNCTDDDPACVLRDHHRALDAGDMVWEICDRCRGEGTLGGWPGAYTESDRAEWSDDDYEDYCTTRRPCEDCGGAGKVKELSDEALARPIVREWLNDYWDTEATYAAERRMGA